ncbi:peptidase M15D vanX D-ala-D-ala dipeptidase [Allomuricauda ruestringensis DSM 13258]|uniref:D-alanyl-D-alanine dipeptidase n=1 Tax=Allomuricauda ruestringensis (strain DSM 13258 / CIP 107369 / LMG 19739 / B1) TaxID=886377 RepID=G2PNE5_ALLRU|nr:M15 family metallopeptidase [Allomuricauda ruestringensis]AEM71325.1 peptidase M15D vanX D-ala-D-ala dipeptidase [Allomuricauda ruestringensis DSM 13258]
MKHPIIFLGLLLMVSCKQKAKNQNESAQTETAIRLDSVSSDTIVKEEAAVLKTFEGLADTTFVRLADFSEDFAYDMRYATENNFLKAKVYDCAECYTRVKTARALIEANKDFMEKGVKIKFFDCYRPNSVQYKMWEIVPNPQYVANPDKGSIHNKGGAVDITLVDMEGNELDMGTDFDYFGKRAYHDNLDLPQEILDNRKLLKETMEAHGFWSIRTEWWHYNLSAASNDRVANFKWECND